MVGAMFIDFDHKRAVLFVIFRYVSNKEGSCHRGVGVGFSIEIAVIPKLLAVVENFLSQYYNVGQDDQSVLEFMRKLQHHLHKKRNCKDVLKDLLATRFSFSVGIDISISRGLVSLGALTVLPKTGAGFGVPGRLFFSASTCLAELGISGMNYIGDHNPSYSKYTDKGANLFKGLKGGIKSAGTALSKAFYNDLVDFNLGYSFALGKGFHGVGFGLSLSCSQKKGAKRSEGVMADCYSVSKKLLKKFAKSAGVSERVGDGRRRLLATVQKKKEKHVDLGKAILARVNAKYKELSHQIETTSDPALLEILLQKRAENKVIFLSTAAIVGIVLGSTGVIGGGIAGGIAIAHTAKANTGMNGKPLFKGAENIAETALSPFAKEYDTCRGGLALTYDFMDVAINIQYSKGPIRSCIQSICKSVLTNVGYTDNEAISKCTLQKTKLNSENPLLATPKQLAKEDSQRTAQRSTVYRWRIQGEQPEDVEDVGTWYGSRPWSGEISHPWNEWTKPFTVIDIEGKRTHSMCIQTRMPAFHDIYIHLKPDNDIICKVRAKYVNDMIEDESPSADDHYGKLDFTWVRKGAYKDDYRKEREYWIERKLGNGWHGGVRKDACGKAENYMLCFTNCNGYTNGHFKVKFTKKVSRACTFGKLAKYVQVGEEVKLTNKWDSSSLRKALILNLDERAPNLKDEHFFEVVRKPGAGKDKTCCSNYCDGEFCTEHENVKPRSGGKCLKTREEYRNEFEAAKYKKTRCYQFLEKKWRGMAMLVANSKKSKLVNAVQMARAKSQLKKLSFYKMRDEDGNPVQIKCGKEAIKKMDEEIKTLSRKVRDNSNFGCGKKGTGDGWKSYNPDEDEDGTTNKYELALLGNKQRGRLGVCIGAPKGTPKDLHGLTIEDVCNCEQCGWKLMTIFAKKEEFERIRLDNDITTAWTERVLRYS